MFNSEQKEGYIESVLKTSKNKEVEKNRKFLMRFFDRLADAEIELGKDFAMCDYNEMKTILSIICRRSVKYQKSILSRLRKYLDWSIEAGKSLDTENRLVCVAPSDIDFSQSSKMSMVKDEAQLADYLDIVLEPLYEDKIDNMYRAALHLVFQGLTLQEAIDLQEDNLDLGHRLIQYDNGKKIPISEICFDVLKYVTSMDVYLAPTKSEAVRVFNIAHDGYVLERTIESRRNMKESMIPHISGAFKNLKVELGYQLAITLSDILLSGIFFRAYQNECKTGEIDLSEYILKSENYIGTIKNPEWVLNDGTQEYIIWKKAFDL